MFYGPIYLGYVILLTFFQHGMVLLIQSLSYSRESAWNLWTKLCFIALGK